MVLSISIIYLLSILPLFFLPFSLFWGGYHRLPDIKEENHPEIVFFSKATDTLKYVGNLTAYVILSSSMETPLVRFTKLCLWYSPTRLRELNTIFNNLAPGLHYFTFYYYISKGTSTVNNVRFPLPFLIPADTWMDFGGGDQKPFYVVDNSSEGYQGMVSIPVDSNKKLRSFLELSTVHIWTRINQLRVFFLTGTWFNIHYNMDNLVVIKKVS